MTSGSSTSDLIDKYGKLTVLDDLILLRAADDVQCPILAYPSPGTDGSSYEYYTGRDLDRMITKALDALVEYGFKPQRKDSYLSRSAPPVVALLTLSDIDMVVTFFALSRLGYTVMMLSPRLSASSCVSLLDTVECDTIFYGQTASIRATMGAIIQLKEVSCRPIHFKPDSLEMHQSTLATLSWYEGTGIDSAPEDVAVILHSSGSTGTPKPLFLTHKALMTHPLRGPGLTSFNSLPWYHLHGLSTAFQAMWMRKTAFMWDASLPVTGERLTKALNGARPESVHAVPYVLQLLVDAEGGIEALKDCKLVTYGGAPCPDELGDKLVRAQVKFGGSFGLTEAGLVAESISRSPQDPYWNYLRFFENIRPYIWMKPLDEENTDLVPEQHDSNSLYECVYLSGHPALTASNSDNPPGSFHSRDVFKPHPSIPERWKYITRLDDRITLVNGEKVLPLPIEGLIKQHPLIQDAVVVGVGRATPGLLIFRSDKSIEDNLSEAEYLEATWPAVEEANSRAEKFSQISKDTIAILSSEVALTCPRTDKGSLIRTQVYRQFSDVIDSIYAKFDQPGVGTLMLDRENTKEHLMRLCDEELGLTVQSADADLFSAGVDSLKAIHFRRLILRDFYFSDSSKLGQNVVFETATVSRLAENIVALQNGKITNGESGNGIEDELSLMSELIAKYSTFRGHLPVKGETGDKKSAVLTGPTGSIGIHTLVELLQDTGVAKVYCLSRRESPLSSILEAMEKKGFTSPELLQHAHKKIVPLKSTLDSPNLGLDKEVFYEMLQKVSVIIHTAWPVNFQLPLRSFEEHIRGLYNLIQFSLDVKTPEPAVVLFCSSISTAMGKIDSTNSTSKSEIPDKPMDDFTSALDMGYARSKLVGERIVSLARGLAGARAYSLRIGQVSGHSEMGLWNDSEAIPLTIRSALTIRALPELNETCSWLPVDKLAKTIVEIAESKLLVLNNKPNTNSTATAAGVLQDGEEEEKPKKAEKDQHCQYDVTSTNTTNDTDDTVYNICNPNTFTWSQLLTALRQTGFTFTTVPFETWLKLLRESEEKGEEHVNPAIKLIGFYDMHSGRDDTHSKKFRTDRAEKDSETLRSGGLDVIGSGILGRYARDWLERWI